MRVFPLKHGWLAVVLMQACLASAATITIVENGDGHPDVSFSGFSTKPTCIASNEALGCNSTTEPLGAFVDLSAAGAPQVDYTLTYIFDLGESDNTLSDRLRLTVRSVGGLATLTEMAFASDPAPFPSGSTALGTCPTPTDGLAVFNGSAQIGVDFCAFETASNGGTVVFDTATPNNTALEIQIVSDLDPTNEAPEPASLGLVGLGLLGMAASRRVARR